MRGLIRKNDWIYRDFCPGYLQGHDEKTRFTKSQIVTILELADSGIKIDEIYRQQVKTASSCSFDDIETPRRGDDISIGFIN